MKATKEQSGTSVQVERGSMLKSLGTMIGGDHYLSFAIQPVEFALANKLNFFQKDILKYTTRRKGDKAKRLEDLNKAKHYLDMYIEAVEKDRI